MIIIKKPPSSEVFRCLLLLLTIGLLTYNYYGEKQIQEADRSLIIRLQQAVQRQQASVKCLEHPGVLSP